MIQEDRREFSMPVKTDDRIRLKSLDETEIYAEFHNLSDAQNYASSEEFRQKLMNVDGEPEDYIIAYGGIPYSKSGLNLIDYNTLSCCRYYVENIAENHFLSMNGERVNLLHGIESAEARTDFGLQFLEIYRYTLSLNGEDFGNLSQPPKINNNLKKSDDKVRIKDFNNEQKILAEFDDLDQAYEYVKGIIDDSQAEQNFIIAYGGTSFKESRLSIQDYNTLSCLRFYAENIVEDPYAPCFNIDDDINYINLFQVLDIAQKGSEQGLELLSYWREIQSRQKRAFGDLLF